MVHRAKPSHKNNREFITKGGLKLAFALEHFQICVTDVIAADLGSHQGGFVDCLLQHGVKLIYSVDTCYGTLAWSLRQNSRVVIYERTNALYWQAPQKLDVITIDVGWTRQNKIIPVAVKSLKPEGTILTLLKPQYEMTFNKTSRGVLTAEEVDTVIATVRPLLQSIFADVSSVVSPYVGSGGNREIWFYLKRPRKNICYV